MLFRSWSTNDSSTYSTAPYSTDLAVFNQQTATTNSFASIFFQGGKNSAGAGYHCARFGVINDGTTYGGAIAFANRNGSTGNMIEAMRIDSSQRVGIGNTSPSYALDVNPGTSGGSIRVANTANTNTASFIAQTSLSSLTLSHDGTGGYIEELGAYPIRFFTNSNERARIDSSGRLLVGTSTARANFYNSTETAAFQVEGTGSNRRIAVIADDSSGAGAGILLGAQRSNAVGGNTIVASGSDLGTVTFQGSDGTEFVEAACITAQVDGTPGANDMPGRIVLSTTADGASSPTERLRIKQNGDASFGLGASNPGAGTAGTIIRSTDDGIMITVNTGPILRCYSLNGGSPDRLQIANNGNVTNANNSYTGISDIRLKENIVDAQSQWQDIKSLRVRYYNFKQGQTHRQIGLIAQEVEEVSPGLIVETIGPQDIDNGVAKGVNYSVLYMKAVKALQEAMERIEQLETSNADLLARVTALEAQ